MDLHRRRKRSNTLQSSKKKPLALNIQNIHQWKKIGEKSNDISTVIFVKCVVVGCGLWLSWEGWCQGASHHLIVPFLFYTIGHWEWGACGDRRKAASSSQSDIKVAKRKHERYAWATAHTNQPMATCIAQLTGTHAKATTLLPGGSSRCGVCSVDGLKSENLHWMIKYLYYSPYPNESYLPSGRDLLWSCSEWGMLTIKWCIRTGVEQNTYSTPTPLKHGERQKLYLWGTWWKTVVITISRWFRQQRFPDAFSHLPIHTTLTTLKLTQV